MASLSKPGFSRKCENCDDIYNDKIEKCMRCKANPQSDLNWNPNVELATKIVLHYLNNQPMISVEQIAKHYEASTDSIKAGMQKLIDDGVIEITQTISIKKKKRK